MDLDNPTVHWIIRFRIVCIALFSPSLGIIVSRLGSFAIIASQKSEYLNPLFIDSQSFKKLIRFLWLLNSIHPAAPFPINPIPQLLS